MKRESGQAVVLVALLLVAVFGFAALSIDIGSEVAHGINLQKAADAAALYGATVGRANNWDTGTIESLVGTFLQNNYSLTSATISPDQTNQTVKVSLSENNPFHLAPVIGFSKTNITRTATAKLGLGQSPFDYAIFSNNSLTLTSAAHVTGEVHCNSTVALGGLSGGKASYFTGGIESIGGVYYNSDLLPPYPSWMNTSSTGTIVAAETGPITDNGPDISMPDLSTDMYNQALSEGHIVTASNYKGQSGTLQPNDGEPWNKQLGFQWTYDSKSNTFLATGSNVVLPTGTWYFEGNLDLTKPGGDTIIDGGIFATGTIALGGDQLNQTSDGKDNGNTAAFYSASSSSSAISMSISSSNTNYIQGTVYAPNGGIILGGGVPYIDGQVIGQTVTASNGITVTYHDNSSILANTSKAYLSN